MSISTHWVEYPKSVIGKAYEEAIELIYSWSKSSGNEEAARSLWGWPFVTMSEGIAYKILVTAGYDLGLLDYATDMSPPDGWSMGDLFSEMERTKGIVLPADWEPGDALP